MLGIISGAFLIAIAFILLWLRKEADDKPTAKMLKTIAIICLILSPVVIIGFDVIVTIPAGTVGILNTFGSVSDDELPPGIQIKNPFSDIVLFSIQTQELKESSSVPSKEGLIVSLDISILIKIDPNKANEIYKKIGIYFGDIVIIPQLRSVVREVTAMYEAKALYTTGRENITIEIFNLLKPLLEQRGILLEKVLLRDLQLPLTVTTAIEMKLKAEQEAQQMQFVLQKETLEAQRKIIEAGGIAESQTIIHQSLTTEYLRWYWITHLKDYSAVYYVPIGNDGYPIMNIPVGGK
jgi:prohibitin 1